MLARATFSGFSYVNFPASADTALCPLSASIHQACRPVRDWT